MKCSLDISNFLEEISSLSYAVVFLYFFALIAEASGLITSWEIDGETLETVSDFIFFFVPKSLQMVIAAMKLKDAYSLEGKL